MEPVLSSQIPYRKRNPPSHNFGSRFVLFWVYFVLFFCNFFVIFTQFWRKPHTTDRENGICSCDKNPLLSLQPRRTEEILQFSPTFQTSDRPMEPVSRSQISNRKRNPPSHNFCSRFRFFFLPFSPFPSLFLLPPSLFLLHGSNVRWDSSMRLPKWSDKTILLCVACFLVFFKPPWVKG